MGVRVPFEHQNIHLTHRKDLGAYFSPGRKGFEFSTSLLPYKGTPSKQPITRCLILVMEEMLHHLVPSNPKQYYNGAKAEARHPRGATYPVGGATYSPSPLERACVLWIVKEYAGVTHSCSMMGSPRTAKLSCHAPISMRSGMRRFFQGRGVGLPLAM